MMSERIREQWQTAAWAAMNLARHAGIACGARDCQGDSPFHEMMAQEELKRVAEALGFELTPAPVTIVTEAA